MASPAPFEPITELFQRNIGIRHVYGEPVQRGDITVIPVAKVAYGFGAGGGYGPGHHANGRHEDGESRADKENGHDARGAGGGGGVRLTPVGALEIGPDGTRFVPVRSLMPLVGMGALGLAVGWLLSRRRS